MKEGVLSGRIFEFASRDLDGSILFDCDISFECLRASDEHDLFRISLSRPGKEVLATMCYRGMRGEILTIEGFRARINLVPA